MPNLSTVIPHTSGNKDVEEEVPVKGNCSGTTYTVILNNCPHKGLLVKCVQSCGRIILGVLFTDSYDACGYSGLFMIAIPEMPLFFCLLPSHLASSHIMETGSGTGF